MIDKLNNILIKKDNKNWYDIRNIIIATRRIARIIRESIIGTKSIE